VFGCYVASLCFCIRMVQNILPIKSSDEWATTKQASRDKTVVFSLFSICRHCIYNRQAIGQSDYNYRMILVCPTKRSYPVIERGNDYHHSYYSHKLFSVNCWSPRNCKKRSLIQKREKKQLFQKTLASLSKLVNTSLLYVSGLSTPWYIIKN